MPGLKLLRVIIILLLGAVAPYLPKEDYHMRDRDMVARLAQRGGGVFKVVIGTYSCQQFSELAASVLPESSNLFLPAVFGADRECIARKFKLIFASSFRSWPRTRIVD
jgi:hypothetical protein